MGPLRRTVLAIPLLACSFDESGDGSGADAGPAAPDTGGTTTAAAPGSSGSSDGAPADSSGSDGAGCPLGALGCPCDNGSCATNLVCDGDVCIGTGVCGDGVVDPGEDCDEPDEIDDDGCNTDCTRSTGVAAVFVGGDNSCALSHVGGVRCWGDGTRGRLGLQSTEDVGTSDVPSDHDEIEIGGVVRQLAIGTAHICALLEGGSVRCWGVVDDGRLGYGAAVTEDVGDDEVPASVGDVPLPGSGRAVAIASNGQHTCVVIDVDRQVACWGSGKDGRLGYGDVEVVGDDETPAEAGMVDLGPVSVVDVGAGASHTCALLDDGGVICWGDGITGRLGTGQPAQPDVGDDESPAVLGPIELAAPAVAISVGSQHSCALLDDGRVSCWGAGASGRLGNGVVADIGDDETPIDALLQVGAPVLAVSAGRAHTCLLLEGGGVRCFGEGKAGKLGTGNTDNLGDKPGEVPSSFADVSITDDDRRALAVGTGVDHTCVRLDGGAVRCWGAAAKGQLGYGNTTAIGDNELPSVADDVSCAP